MKVALLSIALVLVCCLNAHPQALRAKVGKAALELPPEKANPVKLSLFTKPPVIDGQLDDEVWQTAIVLKDFYQVQPGDNLIPENRTEVRLGYDARFLYIAFYCFDDPTKVRANKNSWLAQAGKLTGLEGLTVSETGKRKSALPLYSLKGTPDPGRFVNEPIKFDVGLTGKYTLTPTVMLDFTVNPDFAQVESDQLVVTANQRFPIFFEEKRPFFLEGIDIFNTQIAAVHTRTIIDPDVAVKLTGKVDRNTFGLLLASDNGPGNFSEEDRTDPDVFPGIQRFVDKNAAVGILRLEREIGKSDSFIGFLTTYYRFVDKYNELGGFDGRFRIDKQTTFSWQVLGTHSRHEFFFPEEGKFRDSKQNGFVNAVDYNQSGRHFGHEFSMVGRTRYYVADVGFNRRLNTNDPNWFIRYNSEPDPKAKLISWRVYTDFNANFDWQGRSQNFNNESQIQFQLRKQTYFGAGVDKGYDRVFESEFGAKRQPGSNCVVENTCTFAGDDNERSSPTTGVYFFGGSNPSKKYNFNFFLNRVWGAMDFDFGAGPKYPRVSPPALAADEADENGMCETEPGPAICRAPQDPGPGDFWHFDAGVTYQPTSAINARLSYTKERLTRYDTGRTAFDVNIISLRTTYQFTRFLFARGRVDDDSLGSNVKGQFLLGWTPNPGTAFYAGYNDDVNRNGFSPFTGQTRAGFPA